MKTIILLLTVCLFANNANAQKSKEYYSLLLKADDMIIENKLDSALHYYDIALEKFNYPFYVHVKRAAIIANYSEDKVLLEKFLTKCVQKGMPRYQLEYFLNRKLNLDIVNKIQRDYSSYYDQYLAGIDITIVFKYLDLDARDYFLHDYLYMYSKNYEKDAFYAKFQDHAVKEYLQLIDEVGYPSEENVGLPKITEYELAKNKKLKADKWTVHKSKKQIELIDGKSDYYIAYQKNPDYLFYCDIPGNWLLWHYASFKDKDSTLLRYLEKGFDDLKLSPVYITEFFESSFDIQYDYCTSYNSYLFRTKYRSVAGIYTKSTTEERKHINSLRAQYFIPAIEKEEQLIKALYELKYDKEPKDISKKVIKKIGFEYGAFISFYNL